MSNEINTLTKFRIKQLYQFLRAANQLRNRPIREVSGQIKSFRFFDLPHDPSIQFVRPAHEREHEAEADFLFRIRRPALTTCPKAPAELEEWLLAGWDDPAVRVQMAETRNCVNEAGETVIERFDAIPERVEALVTWSSVRAQWAETEKEARKAAKIFEQFYEIHGLIEKEGEQIELVVADGVISWAALSSVDGQVNLHHPILIKRVELCFDPNVPEFRVVDTEREAELYNALLLDIENVQPQAMKERQKELEQAGYHPLGWEDTTAFLKTYIQTVSPLNGMFLDEPASGASTPEPRLWRDPMLILRKRTTGIANAIDKILDDIEQRPAFSSALARITGTYGESWSALNLEQGEARESGERNAGGLEGTAEILDEDILLAKEANQEQLHIIRRLSRSGAVIVQGPPGTGKTHTIGNLIGHLLAEGKSILITSQTTKALRVLKEKVPEPLQSLCVSVLDSDQQGRRQLEASISAINERFTHDNEVVLLRQASVYRDERKQLLKRTRDVQSLLRQALENEYKDIVAQGQRFTPSDAARWVATNQEHNAWIPAPVVLDVPLPLDEAECIELYASNALFTLEEERDAEEALPDLSALPSAAAFSSLLAEWRELTTRDLSSGWEQWQEQAAVKHSSEQLAQLYSQVKQAFNDGSKQSQWRAYAIVAGMQGGLARELWEHLINAIEKTCEYQVGLALLHHHKPALSPAFNLARHTEVTQEILAHFESGGRLGMVQLVTRGEWRKLIQTARVAAGKPERKEHFEALLVQSRLVQTREELSALWSITIAQHGGPTWESLGVAPEQSCRALIPEIRRALDWHKEIWLPLKAELEQAGLVIETLLATIEREATPVADYHVIEQLGSAMLPALFETRIGRVRLQECDEVFQQLEQLGVTTAPDSANRGCWVRLTQAVRARNAEAYQTAFEYIARLHQIQPAVQQRANLLERLAQIAPAWAAMIASRKGIHNDSHVPGDVAKAWLWRQLHEVLADRDRLDASALQREMEGHRRKLRHITTSLIDTKAWGFQLKRIHGKNTVRQALVGWLDTMKKLAHTRKLNIRTTLLQESRRLMRACLPAVPVWIMPLATVAESFDPVNTRFDVVIIDEASQANVNGLIPLYLADRVVIVGDHEQVTPDAVGVDQTLMHNIIATHLHDIPNAHLYDARFSIYDLGRQAFGDAIRLVEHFRCVPEIIEFSNQLSYDGAIRPLRESDSTHLKPACVPIRVFGTAENKINRAEVDAIVELIKAMCKHPAYEGKTIGVISLVGDHQAILIDQELRRQLDPVEIEKRRILCGNPANFQGDERDIVFLSVIDSKATEESQGPIRLKSEGAFEATKKRYNVAASRARDQLWVVHSLDPDRDLKPDDIRRKLIKHAYDPGAVARSLEKQAGRTESPFEQDVLKALTQKGYNVHAQWRVGYYRIDMVVEGGGKRLAIECDGDRWHPVEKLQEDMDRQATLERLGWVFERIRGSAFYRNPELAMKSVFQRLDEMGIVPELSHETTVSADYSLVNELKAMLPPALLTLPGDAPLQENFAPGM